MSDPRLVTYLVGARAGGGLGLPRFTFDTLDVFFEPDVDCIADINHYLKNTDQDAIVLPFGLWSQSGEVTLHINYDPYTSSVYPTAVRLDEATSFINGYDYVAPVSMRTVEQRRVSVVSLDDLRADKKDLPPPDVMILDTQGSELQILRGSTKALSNVIAIICEVGFLERYVGQELFGDVTRYLAEFDLEFSGFVTDIAHHEAPHRVPIGMRGRGYTSEADAIYLRSIASAQRDDLMLKKLAFVAHHLRHHAFGFQCMSRIKEQFGPLNTATDDTRQVRFLAELELAILRQPQLTPWAFHDFYTAEDSRNRFVPAASEDLQRGLRKHINAYASFLQDNRDTVERLRSSDWTPVEEVFRAHNLHRNAEAMRSLRIEQIASCLRYAEVH